MWSVLSLEVITGMTPVIPTATISIQNGDGDNVKRGSGTGNGPISAVCTAIREATGEKFHLSNFKLEVNGTSHIGGEEDAIGGVFVQLEIGNRLFYGVGKSTDIIMAAAKAVIEAINQALTQKEGAHAPL